MVLAPIDALAGRTLVDPGGCHGRIAGRDRASDELLA
jgi:hypothetical protein